MAMNPYDTPTGKLRSRAETTRRQFLGIMGGVAGMGALLFGGIQTLKFMVPNATNEEPTAFTATSFDPTTLVAPHVEPITDKRVTLVLDDKGWYAVFLVCTHLGCTPNYTTSVLTDTGVSDSSDVVKQHYGNNTVVGTGWACPCHGSRYYIDSTNFFGPAPRPMDWVKVTWSPDKRHLIVDRGAIVVKRNNGVTTPPTWRLSSTAGDNTISGDTAMV